MPELLVFDHVGMPQAGHTDSRRGIHSGKELQRAVLREVAEETGLLTASVVQQISAEDKPHPDTRQPPKNIFLRLQATATAADAFPAESLLKSRQLKLSEQARMTRLPQ